MRLMKWPTWHIIGNSSSILDEDLSGLPNTIGVNRILRHKTFVPDYLLLTDDSVLHQERKRVERYEGKLIRYRGLKWGVGRPMKRGEAFDIEAGYFPIRRFKGLYAHSCNTAIYAVEYASRQIHPGRGQIVLHGVDFTSKPGRPSHFFGDGNRVGCSSNSWHDVLRRLKETVKFLWTHNIRLLNGSPWTGPLDKILPRTNDAKCIIGS